jgi:hypothetical protein
VSNNFADGSAPWTEDGLTWDNAPIISGATVNVNSVTHAPVIFSAMADFPYSSSEVQKLLQYIVDHKQYLASSQCAQ